MSATVEKSTTTAITLVTEIEAAHKMAQSAFASAVENAAHCGQLLLKAKAQVTHGEWGDWLDRNFPAGKRTAQGYMRLAEHGANAQALAHLGIEGALKQLAAPKSPAPTATTTTEPVKTYEITTKRQGQIANKEKGRLENMVWRLEGFSEAIDAGKPSLDRAVAAATPEEIDYWVKSLEKSARALRRLRDEIKREVD